ncbi:teichoic acid transporter [Bradyrhizobium sp. LVM 105]|uniref:lipopolysaccharide biosynthesis protein n=1 Tax=Bradyrhizobium sp. LVM 105 TaxID=2341115 RepID=UPI000F7FCE91|nr:teichoic acid transporter [Bradyrhizobium sp. LVM 105]RTE87994.1 teichoic acid transporter [Bradyrhizobium sp. LVM 105]
MTLTMRHSFHSIAATFGAQIYNQIVTVGVQLAIVPVLLYFWGTERYGAWILLSAVPTYLTFADFGFTMAAKNVMTIKVANGDRTGALITYQSIFTLLTGIIAVILCLALIGLPSLHVTRVFGLDLISERSANLVLMLLATNVLLTQYMLLFASGFRCTGRPAEEVAWGASARLMEGIVTAVAATITQDLVVAALAIVSNRTAFAIAAWLRLRLLEPWLSVGYQHATLAEARRLFQPSLSFMLVSIGQAITIQGPVIVLGLTGTPAEVVIFSTSRTLARLGTSAANIFNFALTPEYSRLFGVKRFRQFSQLARIHFFIAVGASVFYVAVLSAAGNDILSLWTKGAVVAHFPFFIVLLLAVAAEMIWTTELIPLASINKHVAISRAFSASSLVAIALSYLIGRLHGGLTGVAAPLLALHCALVILAGSQLWSLLDNDHEQSRRHET